MTPRGGVRSKSFGCWEVPEVPEVKESDACEKAGAKYILPESPNVLPENPNVLPIEMSYVLESQSFDDGDKA